MWQTDPPVVPVCRKLCFPQPAAFCDTRRKKSLTAGAPWSPEFGQSSLCEVRGNFHNLAENIVYNALGIANALNFLCVCED